MADGWNDEYVEKLKKLWSEGLSASQIASRLGTVTRNAVIGKVHRLGLSGRATTSRKKNSRPRPRQNVQRVARAPVRTPTPLEVLFKEDPVMIPVEEIVVPMDKRKGVLDLEVGDCRWPIGDPKEADFHFCHHKSMAGLPYCETHSRRSYQPPKPAIRAGVTAGADSGASGRVGNPDNENASSGLPERKLETAE